MTVEILGTTGTPVLLLPGGAAPSRGFFPHLEQALTPQHRVVLVDRPGTGRAVGTGPATLPSGSAACADALIDLAAGPALVVGQSLGGALAVQFATDHPDLVSGLVLIDPTPVNAPAILKRLGPLAKVMLAPTALPIVGPAFEKAATRRTAVADDLARSALDRMVEARSLYWTGKALSTLSTDGAALTRRLRPLGIPVVLLTADRKPQHPARKAHEALVDALGGRIVAWPGAVHAEHLRAPHQVTELVLEVLTELDAVV